LKNFSIALREKENKKPVERIFASMDLPRFGQIEKNRRIEE
jgi:hypothetical protein